jgi:hypothetical protein
MCTKFCSEILNVKYHLEVQDVDRMAILKCILKKYDVKLCTSFVWLKMRGIGGLM